MLVSVIPSSVHHDKCVVDVVEGGYLALHRTQEETHHAGSEHSPPQVALYDPFLEWLN